MPSFNVCRSYQNVMNAIMTNFSKSAQCVKGVLSLSCIPAKCNPYSIFKGCTFESCTKLKRFICPLPKPVHQVDEETYKIQAEAAIKDFRESNHPSKASIELIARDVKLIKRLVKEKIKIIKWSSDYTVNTFKEVLKSKNIPALEELIAKAPYKLLSHILSCFDDVGPNVREFLMTTDLIDIGSITPDQQASLWEMASLEDDQIEFLKDLGFDINIRDSRGLTPLMNGSGDAVKRLVKAGADPYLTWKSTKGVEYTILDSPFVQGKEIVPLEEVVKGYPRKKIQDNLIKDSELDRNKIEALLKEVEERNKAANKL